MPIFNLFKNCSYYWGFAAFVSYFVNHPLYTPPPEAQTIAAFSVAAACQLSNLWCHLILANLRSGPEDKGIKIPKGFLFNYITCANYTCEVRARQARGVSVRIPVGVLPSPGITSLSGSPSPLGPPVKPVLLPPLALPLPPAQVCGWLAFSVGVQALPAALFMVAGAYQMALWALQKHKRLKKVWRFAQRGRCGSRAWGLALWYYFRDGNNGGPNAEIRSGVTNSLI